MSTFKKGKVVILPTNQQTKYLMVYSDVEKTKGKLILNGLKNDEYKEYQHLYIISDDEIKEDDWYYDNVVLQIRQWKSFMIYNKLQHKKVIATTDSSLEINSNFDYNQLLPNKNNFRFYLPQPSQQFIQKYIEEYNKGNVITDVLVEYNCGDSHCSLFGCQKHLGCKNESIQTVKINPKDNTITIKKLINNWNRKEVETIVKSIFRDIYTNKDWESKAYSWIEENL